MTLDEDGKGKVTIRNETALPLELTLSVVRAQGSPVASATVAGPPEGKLGPGAVAVTTIEAADAPSESAVVAVAAPTNELPRGFVLRVPLQASEPTTPAVAEWTVRMVHGGDTQGTNLPLDGTCGGLGIKKNDQLGTVQTQGGAQTVTGNCTSPDATTLALAVPTLGADGGTYKGKLALGETEVALTVEGTWAWWAVLLLILAGIVVALWATAWRGWGRTATDLLRRTYLAEQLVAARNAGSADKLFAGAAAKLKLPKNVQEWTIAKAVRDKLDELRGRLRGWKNPKEDEITKTQSELDELERKVCDWPEVANQLSELSYQRRTLEDLLTYRASITARTLGRAGPLSLSDMDDVSAAIDEALKLAKRWPWAAIQEAKRIASELPEDDPAVAEFEAVCDRFRAASDPAAAIDAIPDFWRANTALQQAEAREPAVRSYSATGPSGAAEVLGSAEWVEVGNPAATAEGLAIRLWLLDVMALGFLVLVAVVAGMQALWIDKTFGGFWDIAAALVWGATAATVAAPLSAALGDLRRSWLTAETVDARRS